MTTDRWQMVKELYETALRLPPDERSAFLDDRCRGSEELRREVESLLSFSSEAGRFLESPAVGEVAEIIVSKNERLARGTRLSHYEIIERIGEGGMGEVFLARDTRLNRKVALKLLAAHITEDETRVSRFRQEAFATSALNHPNIMTIFEIGKWQERDFIVTEFVEGMTLRDRLRKRKPTVGEALEIALQIASALAAAHGAGIVHRDIKPENIMIRTDGLVKVLDFGIAKYRPTENGQKALVETEAGEIIGTAAYMSPEQARGLEVDAQTDIWSLGVILYEMLAGRLPFEGETKSDRIAAILEREPAPLAETGGKISPPLQPIVDRALAKDKKRRYADIAEMAEDLHLLRETTGDKTSTPLLLPVRRRTAPRRPYLLAAAALLLILIAGAFGSWFYFSGSGAVPVKTPDSAPAPAEIKSLAVLPFKPLDASENYLGLGIADAMIRRISQTGKLIVRPTSAVRRYLNEETDALAAARELEVDAVLEGSVQRGTDDHLRVSVNLLRTSDGASLWTDQYDMRASDIFMIQDQMAQQVASNLQLRLDAAQQARLTRQNTANAVAYEYYLKGVYGFDQRGWVSETKPQMETTIDSFKKAIEIDPNYALAHAQLAYAYAWTAVLVEPTEPSWAERAKEQLNRAQSLDSQLAETYLARSLLLWSAVGNFQIEAAVRELFAAQRLNPNVGHGELAFLYAHLGLAELAESAQQRALDIDPTSEFLKQQTLIVRSTGGRDDEWFEAHQKLHPGKPPAIWYLLRKGRLEEAQKRIEEMSATESAESWDLTRNKALLSALKGDFRAAEALIPAILSENPRTKLTYHHAAHDIACIYALEGKSSEAVKWLREAAATGYPCYPEFERDAYLNRIRQAPEFVRFLAEMKAQFENHRREFAQ